MTLPWRDGTAVVFDRPRENQVMLETFNWEDPNRYGYYTRNKEFLGQAQPLESCLVEDPIQVMLTGTVAPIREAEGVLRAADFAEEFALAVTIYERKDFAMIDVIHPVCSKGRRSRSGPLSAALPVKRSWPSAITITTWRCSLSRAFPW